MKRFKLDKQHQRVLTQINDKYLKDLAELGISQNAFDEVHKGLLKVEAYGGNEMSWALYNSFNEHPHNEVAKATSSNEGEPSND